MSRLWSWQALVVALLILMLLWTVRIHDIPPKGQRVIYSIGYLTHTDGGSVELPPDDPPTYCDGWASSFCTAP